MPLPPEHPPERAASPNAAEGIAAFRRLMAAAHEDQADAASVGRALVAEARALLEVRHAVLVGLNAGPGRVSIVASDDAPSERILDRHPAFDATGAPVLLDAAAASDVSHMLVGG